MNLTSKQVRELARKMNLPFENKRYCMFNDVYYIGNTALVVDRILRTGGSGIYKDPRQFPREVTLKYMINAIRNNAHSLGVMEEWDYGSEFHPWNECVGKYPPGYFTHKVGYDMFENGGKGGHQSVGDDVLDGMEILPPVRKSKLDDEAVRRIMAALLEGRDADATA